LNELLANPSNRAYPETIETGVQKLTTPNVSLPCGTSENELRAKTVESKHTIPQDKVQGKVESTESASLEELVEKTDDLISGNGDESAGPDDAVSVVRSTGSQDGPGNKNMHDETAGDYPPVTKPNSDESSMQEDDQTELNAKAPTATDAGDSNSCLIPFAYLFSKKCRNLASSKHPIQTDNLLNILME
jgi:hypothetical protein